MILDEVLVPTAVGQAEEERRLAQHTAVARGSVTAPGTVHEHRCNFQFDLLYRKKTRLFTIKEKTGPRAGPSSTLLPTQADPLLQQTWAGTAMVLRAGTRSENTLTTEPRILRRRTTYTNTAVSIGAKCSPNYRNGLRQVSTVGPSYATRPPTSRTRTMCR